MSGSAPDDDAAELPESFRSAFVGRKVSHAWRGHGSAIFVEFGELAPRTRSDCLPGMPEGEAGLMIQWSWRIEAGPRIVCGSWSDEIEWGFALEDLVGRGVVDVRLFGGTPEICMLLSGDRRVVSFMTDSGDPQWTLFDRGGARIRHLSCSDGILVEG